jgi:Pyruvate/2-oxoacid:ferredoxin oxidoreductase delta subunit
MPELRTVIGGRDDLSIDVSRCLRMRFSESGCRRCTASCPHGAVTLDSGLAINPDHCHGCLLCTAVCPTGAVEHCGNFYAGLVQLAKVPDPVLGCSRTSDCSHAQLSCLGGLSEEHLVALYHTLTGSLTINLSLCGDCPNQPMIPALHQRLDTIARAGLASSDCRVVIAESAKDIYYRAESVDRRSFFTSCRDSLLKSAAVILSTSEQTRRRTEYAGKRVPFRRELLNRTRIKLSQELRTQVRKHFDSRISFDEACARCQGCVAICPTGALQTEAVDEAPAIDQERCTGCGVCREFCLDQAVQISN